MNTNINTNMIIKSSKATLFKTHTSSVAALFPTLDASDNVFTAENAWSLFKSTGSIEAWMLFNNMR